MRLPRKPALLFMVLATAVVVGLSGSSLSPIALGEGGDVAEAVPTVPDTHVPVGIETEGPTSAPPNDPTVAQRPQATQASTESPDPTAPPAPTSTPEPTETPRPEVPENTTGSSIIFERGASGRMEVALTFDAGEGAGYTDDILDFLAERDLRASFGITGEWARAHPELVQRIVNEGHMLFNHSESHQSWTGVSTTGVLLTEDQRIDELLDADQAVKDVAGYDMAPFWRPPYGDYDAAGQELLEEFGYDYTLYWTCDTLAWTGTTPEEIAEMCGSDATGGGPGAIILMHVTQEADYLSLELLVADYQVQGYEFVTMEEMIAE